MSDPTDPLAWMQRAEEDWLLARSALRRKVPLIYGTTFHTQQCVEKYLRDDRGDQNHGESTFE
jgi:HEPN domain-containing protein